MPNIYVTDKQHKLLKAIKFKHDNKCLRDALDRALKEVYPDIYQQVMSKGQKGND